MDLHDFVEDISFLIDGAPQIAFLAIDGDDDLVAMPYSRRLVGAKVRAFLEVVETAFPEKTFVAPLV